MRHDELMAVTLAEEPPQCKTENAPCCREMSQGVTGIGRAGPDVQAETRKGSIEEETFDRT